jgi:hypothetical protein
MNIHTSICVCRVCNSSTFDFIARECNKQGMKEKKQRPSSITNCKENVEPDVRMGGIGLFSGTFESGLNSCFKLPTTKSH